MKFRGAPLAFSLILAGLLSACDGGGSGGGGSSYGDFDFGDNDRNVVVAIGDSITSGNVCDDEGTTYPDRIAGMTGLTVINAGISGERSSSTASRTSRELNRHNPGFLLILTGHNDAIFDRSVESVIGNLRSIVQQAKGNKTAPILATLVPINPPRSFATEQARNYNAAIRQLAKDEGIPLVDLEKEFGNSLDLQCDGLHPNDRGSAIIAASFSDKLP